MPDQADALADHIDACPSCRAAREAWHASDTLMELQQQATSSDSNAPHIQITQSAPPVPAPLGPSTPRPEASYPFLRPPQEADEIGRLGKYRVLQQLGRGGMGIVFLAEDLTLHRRVALKVMQVGRAAGMVALNDALMDLVTKKLVEPEEAYLKAVDKPAFEGLLKRANIDTKFVANVAQ